MKTALPSASSTPAPQPLRLLRAACLTGLLTASLAAPAQHRATGALFPTSVATASSPVRPMTARAASTTTGALAPWTPVAPLRLARSQHAAVAGTAAIYVWGGYPGPSSVPFTSLEIYEVATNTWRNGAPVPVAMRGQASAATADGMIYSFGGTNNRRDTPQYAYRYSPAANTWTALASPPIEQVEAEAETGLDGRIYVFGGEPSANATQIYTPTTNSWTLGAPMPTGRHGMVVIADTQGRLHVVGGYDRTTALSAHEVYDPATNTWAPAAPLPNRLNLAGGTLGPDGNLYVVGGQQAYVFNTPPFYNTVYVYSARTNSWHQDTSLPLPLSQTQVVTVGNSLYTIAGTNGTPQRGVYRTDLCSPPVLTLPANQTVAAATDQCQASVRFAASATPQAPLTYTIGTTPITSPYAFPVGTTPVTVTTTTDCGTATGRFTVTVQDRQAPTVRAAGFITALESDGTRTIEADDVDWGSYDNCSGLASMTISPRTFTCANLGPNLVTFTATDSAGNSASETVIVLLTAEQACPAAVAAASATRNAGFGPQHVLEAYPNPAQGQTTIRFQAPQTGLAHVQVYNAWGRLVATLYEGVVEQGQVYERSFNGTTLPAGLYTCRFSQQQKSITQRVVLTK